MSLSSLTSKFNDDIESNIIDKNYQLSTYKNDIITYYWCQNNIILDILIKENICAINKDNDVLWYEINNNNITKISKKINELLDF